MGTDELVDGNEHYAETVSGGYRLGVYGERRLSEGEKGSNERDELRRDACTVLVSRRGRVASTYSSMSAYEVPLG